jgi:hypothetical protein
MKKRTIYKIEPVMPLFLGFFHVKSFQNENYWGALPLKKPPGLRRGRISSVAVV